MDFKKEEIIGILYEVASVTIFLGFLFLITEIIMR